MDVMIDEMTVHLQATSTAAGERIGRQLRGLIEEELRRLRPDPAAQGALDLGAVDLGTIPWPPGRDPLTLAGLIAERLVDWLKDTLPQREEAP